MTEKAPAAFTQELIGELTSDHYRLSAWRRFMSRSWARSLDDIRESPARTRSFWSWAGVVAAAGSSVVLFAWLFHAPDLAISATVLWLPWYAGSVFFVLTHLGMTDDSRGLPHNSLLLPNGLSFLRLALAPLVLVLFLNLPADPITGTAFALFLGAMLVTDALDGWLARRRKICTRLGRMLDPLADLAFLTFLGFALYRVDAIPETLLWLIVVRYPLMLIGVLVLYFAKGPAQLSPTIIGKVTTFATSAVLLVIATTLLVTTPWLRSSWIDWSVWCLEILIGANILFLIYSGVVWTGSKKTAIDASSR